MLDRMKKTLIESYIGAIALGYLLALVVVRLVNVFIAPLGAWISRNEMRGFATGPVSQGFPFEAALPQLMDFLLLLLFWYVLFRWLYLGESRESASNTSDNE